jgi:hypothetical protein
MLKNRLQGVLRIPWGTRVLAVAVALGAWSLCGLGLAVPGYAGAPQGLPQAAMGAAGKAAQASKPAPQKSENQPSRSASMESGRRDPFYVPPPPTTGGPRAQGEGASGPLPAGKRGLLISELKLEGIVRQEANNTMIAVVANPQNRAYFLRENDAVYDGVVSKITPDSIYFTERYRQPDGHEASREVIKRLSPGPGENR